ncbi:MAG: type IV pilin N-terminal domain-containing protein [Candidatus Poseidoniaceae archaeon]|jgi:flagellin-like protein|nr:type IV pilin N-terminal domain-containing protein [Candidatus Poseidoniaceae archaeon]
MQRNEQAVSPVIATVLLLAITVLLSSMVFVMMSSTLDSVEKADPKGSLSVRALSNGYHVVTFSSLDQSLNPNKVVWTIMSDTGDDRTLLSGKADDSDVYGTVGSNVSFQDRDAGWSVTKGDYFVINCEELGCDDGNHIFQIVDQNSNTVISEIRLPVDVD